MPLQAKDTYNTYESPYLDDSVKNDIVVVARFCVSTKIFERPGHFRCEKLNMNVSHGGAKNGGTSHLTSCLILEMTSHITSPHPETIFRRWWLIPLVSPGGWVVLGISVLFGIVPTEGIKVTKDKKSAFVVRERYQEGIAFRFGVFLLGLFFGRRGYRGGTSGQLHLPINFGISPAQTHGNKAELTGIGFSNDFNQFVSLPINHFHAQKGW